MLQLGGVGHCIHSHKPMTGISYYHKMVMVCVIFSCDHVYTGSIVVLSYVCNYIDSCTYLYNYLCLHVYFIAVYIMYTVLLVGVEDNHRTKPLPVCGDYRVLTLCKDNHRTRPLFYCLSVETM